MGLLNPESGQTDPEPSVAFLLELGIKRHFPMCYTLGRYPVDTPPLKIIKVPLQ